MAKHCFHADKETTDPGMNDRCCWCPLKVEYRQVPVEGHGTYVPWIYNREPIKEFEVECTERSNG